MTTNTQARRASDGNIFNFFQSPNLAYAMNDRGQIFNGAQVLDYKTGATPHTNELSPADIERSQIYFGYRNDAIPGLPGESLAGTGDVSINNNGAVAFVVTYSDYRNGLSTLHQALILGRTQRRTDAEPDLIDPVTIPTSAKQPPRILSTPSELTSADARKVEGVAADGVARVIIRIPTTKLGERVVVTICGDNQEHATACGKQQADTYGALSHVADLQKNLADPKLAQQTVTSEPSVNVASGFEAFIVYRAPVDFARKASANVRSGNEICPSDREPRDCQLASRSIALRIEAAGGGGQSRWQEIKIVRPPVVLIHGYTSSPESWNSFTPIIGPDSPFATVRLDYTTMVRVDKAHNGGPAIVPQYWTVPWSISSNQLGLQWNERLLLPQLLDDLNCFRDACSTNISLANTRLKVAAVQADVVGHSMGGLLARAIWEYGGAEYKSSANFNAGLFHKLITLGTPHLGSQNAANVLAEANICSRDELVTFTGWWGKNANLPIDTAMIKGIVYSSGVDDLVGDGTLGHLSSALKALYSGLEGVTSSIRISYVAAVAKDENYACLDKPHIARLGLQSVCGTWKQRKGFPNEQPHFPSEDRREMVVVPGHEGNPMALEYSAAKWILLFNGADNDGFVPVKSALNGLNAGDDGTIVIPHVVHGIGTVRDIGFCGNTLQSDPTVINRVIVLLNAAVNDNKLFRNLPEGGK